MRGGGRMGYGGPAYEPTPDERKRERAGHTKFLNENKKELALVQERIKNLKEDFQKKNIKLYNRMDKDITKARESESSTTKKLEVIKELEARLKSDIKKVNKMKSKIEKNNELKILVLTKRENTVSNQTAVNRSYKAKVQIKLSELSDERKRLHLQSRELDTQLKRFITDKWNLEVDKTDVSKLKKDLADEILKQRDTTKQLYDKIQYQNTLVNKNIKTKLKLEKDKEKSDELLKRLNKQRRR